MAVSVGDSGCCARPQLCLRKARWLQRCRRRELAESRRRSVSGCGCRRLCSPVPALLLSLGLSPGSAHAVALQGQRHQPLPVLLPWLHEPPRLWRTLPCCLGTAANLGVLPGPRETPGCLSQIPADVMGMCDLFCVVPGASVSPIPVLFSPRGLGFERGAAITTCH